MSHTRVRARLVALVAALPLALILQTRAHAQEPVLEVFYRKLEPKEQFKFKWKGMEAECVAGVFRWDVPQSEFGTNGLGRHFTGYCAEVLVSITADKMYRFQTNKTDAPANYNLAGVAKDKIDDAAKRRTRLVEELFGRYFRDPVLKPINEIDAVAFQIALWEIIQESEPAEGDLKLDLFAGDFQANYPKADAPAFVVKAQQYLDSLTGRDDVMFFMNDDLRGRELIRLQGMEGAEGVAQSQFALRYKGAPRVGGRLDDSWGGNGNGFGWGNWLGSGNLGGGAGRSSLFPSQSSNNGQSPSPMTDPPNPSPSNPIAGGPPTPGTSPSINGGTSGGSAGEKTAAVVGGPPTPGTSPGQPVNSVPAPAGLLLGVIALGTIGVWRVRPKFFAAK